MSESNVLARAVESFRCPSSKGIAQLLRRNLDFGLNSIARCFASACSFRHEQSAPDSASLETGLLPVRVPDPLFMQNQDGDAAVSSEASCPNGGEAC